MRKLIILILASLEIGYSQSPNPQSAIAWFQGPPAAVTAGNATANGTLGPNQCNYIIVARYPIGNVFTANGGIISTFNCQPTLSGTNSVTIVWTPLAGVTGYDVLRLAQGSQPTFSGSCTGCLLASNTTTLSQTDTGAGLANYTTSSIPAAGFQWFLDNANGTVPTLQTLNPTTGVRLNFSNFPHTAAFTVGSSLPATCTIGDEFFLTGVTAGDNFRLCTATNTWSPVSSSGAVGCASLPAFTGDVSKPLGSCATTVIGINGAAVPVSAKILGSNASSQAIAAALTSAHLYVGSGANLPVDVAVSNDVSLANTGAMTVTGLNSTNLAGLATGLLTNTTGTGVPTITALAPLKVRECIVTIGSPAAAASVLANDNDAPVVCGNDYGSDLTIQSVACWADAGTPTVTPILTGGAGNSILTGALTCGTAAWAAGTLNGTPVVHTFTVGAGATCAATPCTIDDNLTTAGGVAKYVVIKIAMTL